jgi:PAS domain S-box-containing protein
MEACRMTTGADEPLTVLLVDDRKENLQALRAILGSEPYRLLSAGSGDEALAAALREDLDLILLDVVMPGMDGFEVARQLKSVERTREVPILFLTAEAISVDQIYRAYSAGAVDYLIKPLEPRMVRSRVAVFAELVRRRRESERQAELFREAARRDFELRLGELRIASDQRYRKLIEGIDHAIAWSADPATFSLTFVSQRAAFILGYPPEVFLGPLFWQTHSHPDDREAVEATFARVLEQAIDQDCTHRVLTADGQILWFRTAISHDTGIDVIRPQLHGISLDVTALKHAEEAALRATQARDELLAVVSHDLRNLLSSIVAGAGRLDRLIMQPAEPQRLRHAVDGILGASSHMDRLVTDLLSLAVTEAERIADGGELSADALDVVDEVVGAMRPLAEEKSVQLEHTVSEPLTLACDRVRAVQILNNLIGNAIKFTPAGGQVTLRAEPSGKDALFSVADTGVGIAADELPHLFERFWQSKSRSGVGVGLGLSIVQRLVQAFGGRIWVESKPGDGTTFLFTLPLAIAPPLAEPPSLPAEVRSLRQVSGREEDGLHP